MTMIRAFHILVAVVVGLIAVALSRAPSLLGVDKSTETKSSSQSEPRVVPLRSNWTTYSRVVAPGRVFSIPDVHGDYEGLVQVLRKIGVISQSGTDWTGGDAVLVQTGDILDRGDDSADCLRLVAKLHQQAQREGGKVIMVMGNHELLNLMGYFHYGTPKETEGFAPATRFDAFHQTIGEFGAFLRTLPAACVVERANGTSDSAVLFVHGGLSTKFLRSGSKDPIKTLNKELARYLQHEMKQLAKYYEEPLLSEHGPLWNRFFALGRNEGAVCSELQQTLEVAQAGKMVVGHTVQRTGSVGTRCGGRLVLGDVSKRESIGCYRRN